MGGSRKSSFQRCIPKKQKSGTNPNARAMLAHLYFHAFRHRAGSGVGCNRRDRFNLGRPTLVELMALLILSHQERHRPMRFIQTQKTNQHLNFDFCRFSVFREMPNRAELGKAFARTPKPWMHLFASDKTATLLC